MTIANLPEDAEYLEGDEFDEEDYSEEDE